MTKDKYLKYLKNEETVTGDVDMAGDKTAMVKRKKKKKLKKKDGTGGG